MDSTLLISLSHQMAASRSMDVIANNLANVSTTAYQREEPTFKEFLSYARPAEGQAGPQSLSFVTDHRHDARCQRGPLPVDRQQLRPGDPRQGLLHHRDANGNLYTRDGHFSLDGDGNMVDANGNKLQGERRPDHHHAR